VGGPVLGPRSDRLDISLCYTPTAPDPESRSPSAQLTPPHSALIERPE